MDSFEEKASWRREVAPWLGDDESILWIGRPDPARFRWESAGAVIFGGIAMVAALLTGTLVVFALVTTRPGMQFVPALSISIPGFFFILGLRGITAPNRTAIVGERTAYVVTTERAIILSGFEFSPERNLRLAAARDRGFEIQAIRRREVKRRRRDGSGDVIFDVRVATRDGRPVDSFEAGFFGIPRVDEVDRILEQVASGGKDKKKGDPDPDFA